MKILMLGNSKLVIFGFRGELIKKLVELGHDVYVSFPNGPFGEEEQISRIYGCHFIETKIDRRGKNPFKDLKLLKEYKLMIKKINPDFVFSYTVKCNIYGGMACNKYNVSFLPNITGLGKGLYEKGIIQKITKFLYKKAIKKAKCVFFQNENDLKFFEENKILKGKYQLLPGSGVNLNKFSFCEMPEDSVVRFAFIGRLMKAKGIDEFLYAAKELKKINKNVEFHICGYCEEDYKSEVEKLNSEGIVVYHGLVDDVNKYDKMCHCIVLPSFHPEGISNVLLEAAATGRPIITTNHVGCKETVEDGVTGYLVQIKNKEDLLEKMEKFISLSFSEKREMGIRGRKRMEEMYDRNIVVAYYLAHLEQKV